MSKKPKGWFHEIVIRPVVHVDGYESYEKVCSNVADVYFSVDEESLQNKLTTNVTDSRLISLYTFMKVGQAKCPAYWVGEDLLTALMQSDLDVEAENLQWAMKTGVFMLPKGIVMSPDNTGQTHLKYNNPLIARVSAFFHLADFCINILSQQGFQKTRAFALPDNKSISAIFWHCDITSNLLYWTAIDKDSVFCRRFQISDNFKKLRYTDTQDFNPQVVTEFNEYLQAIFLRLILIMEVRPELVDTISEVVRISKGFGKDQAQDFYQPLWIGKNYRVQRENTLAGSGTHASPRVHWRRGFLRNQPYGEGRQQRKLVWIEPVLVMGGKES